MVRHLLNPQSNLIFPSAIAEVLYRNVVPKRIMHRMLADTHNEAALSIIQGSPF